MHIIVRAQEYFQELRREMKSLDTRLSADEQRLSADEQRQAADERALLAHIRDDRYHPKMYSDRDGSCLELFTDDGLKLQERDRSGSGPMITAGGVQDLNRELPSPEVIRDVSAKKLVYQYWGKRSVCFVLVSATGPSCTYHFAGCPALYEGEDLGLSCVMMNRDNYVYSRARPGITGYAFSSEGDMRAWARAKGLRPCACGGARKEFHCTAVGSSY
eukprot:tig00000806_g4328.t1